MAGRKPRMTRDQQAGQDPLKPPRTPGSYAPGNMGNVNALRNGMTSKRALNDRAMAIITAYLEDARCPDHLRLPAFAADVMAWGQAEALASFAWDDMCKLMDEEGTAAVFRMQPGVMKAQSEVWKAHAAFASQLRKGLGLSPAGYAKIARELGIGAASTQDQLARMSEEGGEIVQRRLAIVRGVSSVSGPA